MKPEITPAEKKQILEKLLQNLRKSRYIHNISGNYYKKLNMRFILPSIIITSISGMASFLSTAEFLDDNEKNGFSVLVGVFASVSTMLQAFSGAFGFDTKREMFLKAADDYDKLMSKVKFEIMYPNEENFIENVEKDIINIQNNCKFLPPDWVLEQWTTIKNEKNNKKGSDSDSGSDSDQGSISNNIMNIFDKVTDASNQVSDTVQKIDLKEVENIANQANDVVGDVVPVTDIVDTSKKVVEETTIIIDDIDEVYENAQPVKQSPPVEETVVEEPAPEEPVAEEPAPAPEEPVVEEKKENNMSIV